LNECPVYADRTLEQYSVLKVPVGSGRMRKYERRRDRELTGMEIRVSVVTDGPLAQYVRR